MTRVRVKICGIKNASQRDCAVSAGADAVGFVVEVPGSKRSIDRETARSLIEGIPVFVTSVVVTTPRSAEEARGLARDTGADVIQVHSALDGNELKGLRETGCRVVGAVAALPGAEEKARHLSGYVDAVLLDTYKDGSLGGTGSVHDWTVSARLVEDLDVPVILAGGLDAGNVVEAVRRVRPYAVDVSSGVETGGEKDCQKIRDFIEEVKGCRLR